MAVWITKAIAPDNRARSSSGIIGNNDMARFAREAGACYLEYQGCKRDDLSEEIRSAEIDRILSPVSAGDVVFVQFPMWNDLKYEIRFMNRLLGLPQVKTVLVIWDVLSWLFDGSDRDFTHDYGFKLMNRCHLVIAPNKKMASRLRSEGGVKAPLMDIGLWDYACYSPLTDKTFSHEVTFVGTLDKTDFSQCTGDIKINLIGNANSLNATEKALKNINLLGVMENSDIPAQLNSGFGLMSYQNDKDKSGKGYFAGSVKYGRFNNPLKLSLYLAAGVPVIIDSVAAHARLVKRYNIGLVIDNLGDMQSQLKNVTPDHYAAMVANVEKFAHAIRGGFFIKRAISRAVKKLNGL